jgi:hypothetical protein
VNKNNCPEFGSKDEKESFNHGETRNPDVSTKHPCQGPRLGG